MPSLPSFSSATAMVAAFSEFFTDKIAKIRDDLSQLSTPDTVPFQADIEFAHSPLTSLEPASEMEVRKIIKESPTKTCPLDPIPTSMVKEHIDMLIGPIKGIVNGSLTSGHFPGCFKEALITPVIKKQSLDSNNLNNYRPISNLPFLSKVVEKVVAARLNAHLIQHHLRDDLQSAYTKFHSVETALVKVQNDIMLAVDSKRAVLLVLLDLSAAFDTVDHNILLHRLQYNFGITGTALAWFTSYLRDRVHAIHISGQSSTKSKLTHGVPQGSVLGPLLFTLYISPLGRIARLRGLRPHFYADDIQLYATFSPSTHGDNTDAHNVLEACLSDMQQWMVANYLKFNAHKTQFLLICSQHVRHKVNIPDLHVGGTLVAPCSDARNLGVLFDKSMNLDRHVLNVCQSSYVHLRRIAAIRESLTLPAAEQLIHTFISSRLDFCNSLLAGLPQLTLQRLQKVQNAAARLLTRTKTSHHITPILYDLHWLPVNYRIQFKIIVLTFKALHGLAPSYIQDMLQYRTLRPGLRSSSSAHILAVPKTRLATYGDRSFSSIAPRLWNSLPDELRDETDFSSFKVHVKTHLFNLAYHQQ